MTNIIQQDFSLGSSSISLSLPIKWTSGHWPCVKFCLVRGCKKTLVDGLRAEGVICTSTTTQDLRLNGSWLRLGQHRVRDDVIDKHCIALDLYNQTSVPGLAFEFMSSRAQASVHARPPRPSISSIIRHSGHWPCFKFFLVGSRDKYTVGGRLSLGET